MIDQVTRRSRELWGQGYYCAESVLLAIAESRGIQSELIPKIATGFCSGLSGTCGVCGAVAGAIMGLNLVAGRDLPDQSVEPSYARVRELLQAFEERYGSTNCLELTGCDLGTDEGQEAFRANQVGERCAGFVVEATRMALTLIEACEGEG